MLSRKRHPSLSERSSSRMGAGGPPSVSAEGRGKPRGLPATGEARDERPVGRSCWCDGVPPRTKSMPLLCLLCGRQL
jgi:hypothetical protein